MKNSLSKIFIVFLSTIFASCAPQNEQPKQIRIVDLQGKSHGIVTRTPDLNLQALELQGKKQESYFAVKNDDSQAFAQNQNNAKIAPANTQVQNAAIQNTPSYADVSAQTIQKNFQFAPQQNSQQPNPIVSSPLPLPKENQQPIEYDLAKTEEEKIPEKKLTKSKQLNQKLAKKVAVQTVNKKGLFVQVGSFSSANNAKQKLSEMEKFHQGRVETVNGEKKIYRVLLGPFSSKAQAREMAQKITDSGYEAVLMRNK